MGVNKFGNYFYNGNLPQMGGDTYFGQDQLRDFWFTQDKIGQVLKDLGGKSPIILSGGIVTKGTGDTLNITACIGYHKYQIEIPDTWNALPPAKINADIDAIRVESTQQTNMAISSATLDGSTINYVKLRFKFNNGNTRIRTKKANLGSYSYELIPSFEFIVNSVAPTDYEICLASFTGTVGGSFTFGVVSKSDTFLNNNSPIINKIFPVGSFYVQYPDTASNDDATAFPSAKRPSTLFGGTWVEQFNTENVFFRTAGTDYQARSAGLSLDQMQGHWHSLTGYQRANVAGPDNIMEAGTGTLQNSNSYVRNPISDGTNGTPRTGAVTEPRNRLMKLWKRTAL